MTDEQFLNWTKSPQALRCVLVEVTANVSGIDTLLYLSSSGFVTSPTETPANTTYSPCILGGISVTEELSLEGNASISYGEVEISNPDGERDSWLDYIWSNKPINVYVGDMRWPRSDFRLVFSGVIQDIAASSSDRLNLLLRDKSQRFNTSMTDIVLGGTTANKDNLLPLCFGECHNITPLLTDPVLLEYQVHNGQIEDIIEVRDNGVPVGFTKYLATGKFRLDATPVGSITASVQGAKPSGTYLTKIGEIVQHIATTYGSYPFDLSEVDTTNISDFNTLHAQAVGVYLSDRSNVLEVLQSLTDSVGAQVTITSLGKLQINKIQLPATASSAVSYENMYENSLSLVRRPAVIAGVKLGYCKNWTVQANMQSGIPSEHSDLYAKEYLTVSSNNPTIAALYSITEQPKQTDTLLLVTSEAQIEADRRLSLFGTKRSVISYKGTPNTVLQQVGSHQEITHHRFGLQSGVVGQIIKQTTDWLSLKTEVEVLV